MKPTKGVRLTDSDRAELRKLRDNKPWLWSYAALAEYFGCSKATAIGECNKETQEQKSKTQRNG